jgi:hypothetical protein
VVWCGVVWCGVVWCGVVWCGVVWCGVVWCGVVWCGVVWCGVVRCDVVWCGAVWCGVVQCNVALFMCRGQGQMPRVLHVHTPLSTHMCQPIVTALHTQTWVLTFGLNARTQSNIAGYDSTNPYTNEMLNSVGCCCTRAALVSCNRWSQLMLQFRPKLTTFQLLFTGCCVVGMPRRVFSLPAKWCAALTFTCVNRWKPSVGLYCTPVHAATV